MSTTWKSILANAKNQTDDTFARRVSSLTTLTDAEIKDITPNPIEKQNLAKLMGIVSDANLSNIAKAQQIQSIAGLVEIAVPLLKKLL